MVNVTSLVAVLIDAATIHRLPVTNSDTAISGLQKRYFNLSKMGDKLPSDDIMQTPEALNLDEIIGSLPENFQREQQPEQSQEMPSAEEGQNDQSQRPETVPPINKAAFTLAFFGWDTVADGAAGLAECVACFRRLGLWMYKPKQDGSAPVYEAMDVASEHMEYCPWVNGQTQSGTGSVTDKHHELRNGWELLAQGLKVKHRRRARASASRDTSRAVSEAPSSPDGPFLDEGNDESRKASDREWWAKIRRMKEMLHVKSPKTKRTSAA